MNRSMPSGKVKIISTLPFITDKSEDSRAKRRMNRTSQEMLKHAFSEQEKRNISLPGFYLPRVVKMRSAELVQHTMHAVYLLLFPGRPLVTLTEGPFNVIHQLSHLYATPEKCGLLFPCCMWVNVEAQGGSLSEAVPNPWLGLQIRAQPLSGPAWSLPYPARVLSLILTSGSPRRSGGIGRRAFETEHCANTCVYWPASPPWQAEASSVCDIGKPQQGNPCTIKSNWIRDSGWGLKILAALISLEKLGDRANCWNAHSPQ